MNDLVVHYSSTVLRPDASRVLARPFLPGEWGVVRGDSRVDDIIARVMAIPERDLGDVLAGIVDRFAGRHDDLVAVLDRHAAIVAAHVALGRMSPDRVRLLGAYFTQEYAVEGAALTNPSLVAAPDLLPAAPGALPFVLSLRAIGEGHLSSIVFRTGTVDADGGVQVQPATPHLTAGTRTEPAYDRVLFARQLVAAGAAADVADSMTRHLPEQFSTDQLESWLHAFMERHAIGSEVHEAVRLSHHLASANYLVDFDPDTTINQRVLFPSGPTESRGMEDARFVRCTDDDGRPRFRATYTAYDGFEIRPQLIETDDFTSFRIATINGVRPPAKGMALFPRRVGGRVVALTRPDHESIAVSVSDHPREWDVEQVTVWRPGSAPWDLIQLGNCGSPIETPAGWLVLTHGVGPLRRYALGALLLDLEDPTRPLGYLHEALLEPLEAQRDGYVPNVVYSCGGLVHGDRLVVAYGIADQATGFATFDLPTLLERLTA